jgi:hypothetical protein
MKSNLFIFIKVSCFLGITRYCFLGQSNVVEFDFLGKDSIRYHTLVPVDQQVFQNLQLFSQKKNESDLIFDLLTTRY